MVHPVVMDDRVKPGHGGKAGEFPLTQGKQVFHRKFRLCGR
jgi:hypothetical protein